MGEGSADIPLKYQQKMPIFSINCDKMQIIIKNSELKCVKLLEKEKG
jgi:hypothetical protein